MELLSPARGALAALLTEAGLERSYYSISVHPARTLEHVLRFVGYALMVVTIRALALRNPGRTWSLAAPLVVVAMLQAVAGLMQIQAGAPMALGSYFNRNHFAGLMEIALPFAPALAFAALRKNADSGSLAMRPAMIASAGAMITVLLLAAAMLSLSRAGFIIALLGIAQVALFRFVPQWTKQAMERRTVVIVGALAVVFLLAFIFLPTNALIGRFADLAATDEISGDSRVAMWSETLDLVRDYWLTGCGLGTYRSAFVAYRVSSPMFQIPHAHNDFLQYLAELGALGFALGLVPIVILWARLMRRYQLDRNPDSRYLALGCLVSMHSLALHSLVDFNLYIPANALAFAWVLGVAAALAQRNFGKGAASAEISVRNLAKSSRRGG